MAQLELHFQGQQRRPLRVEDNVPAKGTVYSLEVDGPDGVKTEDFVVHFVRRRLWPKKRYDPTSSEQEYVAGGNWEVMLVSTEDIESGKVRL